MQDTAWVYNNNDLAMVGHPAFLAATGLCAIVSLVLCFVVTMFGDFSVPWVSLVLASYWLLKLFEQCGCAVLVGGDAASGFVSARKMFTFARRPEPVLAMRKFYTQTCDAMCF